MSKLIVGELEVGQDFTLKINEKSIPYRVICERPMKATPAHGTRWCLNLQTLQAEQIKCRQEVS